jgi:hypothetical protein
LFVNPQLTLWATFFRRATAENKIKWFAENGWTYRFCRHNL